MFQVNLALSLPFPYTRVCVWREWWSLISPLRYVICATFIIMAISKDHSVLIAFALIIFIFFYHWLFLRVIFFFQTWLHSFVSLFTDVCKKCNYHLHNHMPPTWREFRTLDPFHEECKPWGLLVEDITARPPEILIGMHCMKLHTNILKYFVR